MEYFALIGASVVGYMAYKQLTEIQGRANYDPAAIRGTRITGKETRNVQGSMPRNANEIIVGLGADHQRERKNVPITHARYKF